MPLSTATAETAIRRSPLLKSNWLRPFNDTEALDDLLQSFGTTWSLSRIRARVVSVIQETADTRTLVLRANQRWGTYQAGQHTVIEVEIDGARHQRSYSISSAPQSGRRFSITVKRQPGGKVSNFLHDAVAVGDVLSLMPASGEFLLPQALPTSLLMLSAGSGITPLMAQLRALHASGYAGDVVFLHGSRDRDSVIFGAELSALAQEWPSLKLLAHYSAESGRLTADAIASLVPDYRERLTLLCGPQGLMEQVHQHYAGTGLADRLLSESFSGPQLRASSLEGTVEIRASKSEQVFTSQGQQALLVEAESAGLKPKYGCRIGICRSCQCMKKSGSVQNLLTGEISAAPNQLIQLCISAARSDLELAL